MSGQSFLTSPRLMQQRQALPEFAPLPTPPAATSSLLPTHHNRLHCLSCLGGALERPFAASHSGAQIFALRVLFRGKASSHHDLVERRLTVVCRSRPMEDSQLGDGPLEPLRPGFSRLPHSSLSFIPVDDPAAAPLPPKKIKINTRRGRQRRWKKATPAQAMAGAIVGGLWAALALEGTILAYKHLESHPLAHDLPMGMTNNVNQVLMTMVTGFGGFAVLMFSVSSFGLALLMLKLMSAHKPPMQ